MAHYITFGKVMEEMNGEDSDWCDFDDDLVPDDLDSGMFNHPSTTKLRTLWAGLKVARKTPY